MKQILHRVNNHICAPQKITMHHLWSRLIRLGIVQSSTTFIYKANWTNPKLCILCYKGRSYDTIVLGGSQFTRYNLSAALLRLIKGRPKIRNQAGFFVFDKLSLQIWWRVNQPFIPFIHRIRDTWRKQYYQTPFVYFTDLGQNLLFLALFKVIFLQFFTIFQDNFSGS